MFIHKPWTREKIYKTWIQVFPLKSNTYKNNPANCRLVPELHTIIVTDAAAPEAGCMAAPRNNDERHMHADKFFGAGILLKQND